MASPRGKGPRAALLVARFDPISDAAHREDLRPARPLDLRPQPGQMRLQPEQVGIRLGRPAGPRQEVVGNDVSGGPDQGLEEPELRGRQRAGSRTSEPALTGPVAEPPDERSTRRMTAAIRARSSALPNGLTR
jgi:hypothetical protein